jgi:hypothetical protein
MPSPKLTKEQAELQKVRLAEEVERRRALGTQGKQITSKGFLKREEKTALEIISKTNKGMPDPIPEGYKHPSKIELDNAWKIVNAVREYNKQDVELKKAKLALQKAEFEAKTAGYGENAPDALKKKAEENGGKPKLSTAYNPDWDSQRKITDDTPEDEDYEELEDE